MPAMVWREDEEAWLSRDVTDLEQVERLLRHYPEEAMRVYPVSTDVNNFRHNCPELIAQPSPEGGRQRPEQWRGDERLRREGAFVSLKHLTDSR
jgi:hypothetical protein